MICLTRPVFLVLLTVLMWVAGPEAFPRWMMGVVTVAVLVAVAWDLRGALRWSAALRQGGEPSGRPPSC